MTIRTIAAAAALSLISGAAMASPLGLWATEKNEEGNYLTVEIKPCGDKLCGFIAGAHDKTDAPDPNYENLGRQMVFDMVADGYIFNHIFQQCMHVCGAVIDLSFFLPEEFNLDLHLEASPEKDRMDISKAYFATFPIVKFDIDPKLAQIEGGNVPNLLQIGKCRVCPE